MLERLWITLVMAVALVGLALALVADLRSTIGLFVSAMAGGTVVRHFLHPDDTRRAVLGSVPVAVAFAGWYGFAAVDGGLGLGLALLACLTWPRAVAALVRLVRDGRPIRRLSDEELRVAWRDSDESLVDASGAERLGVVQLRQAYLDEMSRRHPDRRADEQFADPE